MNRNWIVTFVFLLAAGIVTAVLLMGVRNTNRQASIQSLPEENKYYFKEEEAGIYVEQGATVQETRSYTQLVKEFEGRRIQFDAQCQAVPNSVTYKNGTRIMLDNRSGDGRWIAIGSKSYQFPGYGYKILVLSSEMLPNNLFIDCGSAVNVGQILIQR